MPRSRHQLSGQHEPWITAIEPAFPCGAPDVFECPYRALGHSESPPGQRPVAPESQGWAESFRVALQRIAAEAEAKKQQYLRIARLEKEIEELKTSVKARQDSGSVVVPLTSLAPDPFEVVGEVRIVVQPTEDGFLASLFDAGISITGDTQEEAVANLRNLLVDVFDELEEDEQRLGPHPARQLAVLRSLIKRR